MVTLRPILGVALPLLLTALPAAGAAAAGAPRAAWAAGAAGPAGGADTARTTRRIAPGVRLESYDRVEADRWLRVDELVVDLDAPGLGVEYLGGPGAATGPRHGAPRGTVAEAAARHQAGHGRRVVAAVNGDFFDIRGTGAPLGPGIAAGRLLHSAGRGAGAAVGFGPGPVGRVLRLALDGTVTLPGGAVRRLVGHNSARPPADGIAAYTAEWTGTAAALPPGAGAEAEVRDGRVTAVRRPALGTAPPPGSLLLAGRGSAADEVAALRPGDPVRVSAQTTAGAGRPVPTVAVGGRELLVVDGVPQNHDAVRNNTPAPRTAVGFSRDGRQVRIITVDGRQHDSAGITLTALGRLLRERGAHNALNLDGGGSSTLLARHPGGTALTLENSPSDGSLRTVPNGLALTTRSGSGRPAGYRVAAVAGTTRVFPGLTRTLTATGYDETRGPAVAPRPDWWSAPGGAGRAGPDGVFHADRPGSATVYAGRAERPGSRPGRRPHRPRRPHTGELRLEVLGPLARIEASEDRVVLSEPGDSGSFQLLGSDLEGNLAPVEARDVRWHYDRSRWHVDGDGGGGFTVTALSAGGTGSGTGGGTGELRATVPATGATTRLPVSVGDAEPDESEESEDPSDPAESAGPVEPEESGEADAGAGESRAPADAEAAAPGDSARSHPSAVRPSGGPGSSPQESGWVPGLAPWWTVIGAGRHPASLPQRFATGLVAAPWGGPRPAWPGRGAGAADGRRGAPGVPYGAGRRGSVRAVLGGAVPGGPPTGTAPLPAWLPGRPTGPGAAPADETPYRPWRFAVLPGGLTDAEARQAVGRTGAGRVDFVLSAPPGPGGPPSAAAEGPAGHASTETFRRMPGTASFRHRGVRFVPLDTTRPTLEGGGTARLRALRAGIEEAARDPETGALAVVQQHAGPDRVDDREARAQARLLADFRRTSGKSAAVITLAAPVPGEARTGGVLSLRTPDRACTVLDVDMTSPTGRSWVSARERNS
ncbi:phosphodiester glycosidase family protein [Streptomyces sp. NPDC048603]|uniref:phosphodiester glycosidase family protein n=1 Tax=Streptomyces sp. NPDC048603 TaxID=3365577 RepID=UPI0037197D77